MSIISLIAAIDEQGGIGFNNQLLTHLPADLKYFKTVTMGKPIIMGRRTYESIGRPLPGRKNIVLSRTLAEHAELTIVSELQQAITLTQNEPEIMIIGGGQLFSEALALASRLYITKIHHQFPADVFFPMIDEQLWQCRSETKLERDEQNPYDLSFLIYEPKSSAKIG